MATASRRSLLGLGLVALAAWGASRWWAGHSDDRLGAQLAAAARRGDIRMLSSTTCAYCTAARRWMQQQQVPFDECFIETDPNCASRFEAARAAGTPLLLVRGQPQLGFDAGRVLEALSRT